MLGRLPTDLSGHARSHRCKSACPLTVLAASCVQTVKKQWQVYRWHPHVLVLQAWTGDADVQ